MAVRITAIQPKRSPMPLDKIQAHLSIENFQWTNEQNLKSGISGRPSMYEWIVNKQGKAYVKAGDRNILVYGVDSPVGKYIRTLENGIWTDLLLELPEAQ